MSTPFFSLITLVYNLEKYLDESIQSVINQTFGNWELLLIDDGSNDGSSQICDRYADEDDRITAFHIPNGGALAATYYGIEKCRGEYVIVISGDDRLVFQALEIVKKAIDDSASDMVIWRLRKFGAETGESMHSLKPNRMYSKNDILYMTVMETDYGLPLRAVKNKIIKNISIYPSKRLAMNFDVVITIPIICQISSAYIIDDVLYEYRIFATSMSHNITAQKVIDAGKTIQFAEEEIKREGLYNDGIERGLYLTWLKTACHVPWLLYNNSITKEECKLFYSLPIYSKAEKYEQKVYIGTKKSLALYLLRHKHYIMIKILYKLAKATISLRKKVYNKI